MIPSLIALALALLLPLLLYLRRSPKPPPGTSLPPSPPAYPLLGHLPSIPPSHSWFQFLTWSKTHGPLYLLSLLGHRHMIVSTERIANDLLRDRGGIYSSRKQDSMAARLLSGGLRPLFLPYGETWRNVRKLMHGLANREVSAAYVGVQEEEGVRMVRDLVREPGRYETWFERYSAGLILRLAYGRGVSTGEEEHVRRIMRVNHTLERVASPGAYWVDSLPVLWWVPEWLAGWKREGKRLHEEEIDLFRGLLKDGLVVGEKGGGENFCTKWAEKKESYGLSDDLVAYAIGTLFEAGAGTTAAAMMSFMLAMVLHLDEYKKMQEEVDLVVGAERLPTYEDMANLPRVRAVVKEVLRWRPVTAGGLPHMSIKDDVYTLPDGKKVFIPAGTNIHPVQWNIHREKALYPDPESFIPDRWLNPEWPTYKEPLTVHPNLQNFSSFGFGRRICAGQNIAERNLYIQISMIAWSCDLALQKDDQGKDIRPSDWDYVTGFNVQPKWFPFDLRAREGRVSVVARQYERIWDKES